jgi:hypothetical protein
VEQAMAHKSRRLLTCLFGGWLLVGASGSVEPQAQKERKPYPPIPSSDMSQPAPLPILASPLPDRAPLVDVTQEASRAIALSGPLPTRTGPAPFIPYRLPDPFEHQNTLRVRTPAAEDHHPAATINAPLSK